MSEWRRLCSRSYFLITLFGTRTAGSTPRTCFDDFRAFPVFVGSSPDRRGQGLERNPFISPAAVIAVATAALVLVAVVTAVAARAILTIGTLALRAPFLSSRTVRTLIVALLFAAFGFDQFVFALILVAILAALAALVFVASTIFPKHTVVVIGELQEIFGLNPVPGKLCIAGHVLIFLEQLGGITALTIVRAIAGLAPDILTSLPPATATAATLTIIDQIQTSLNKKKLPLRFSSGRAALAALTLSSRSALDQARNERPIASGVERDALSFQRERNPVL